MPRLTAMDEHFVHQLPEPLPITAAHHHHWRESYFFVVHDRAQPGDVVILAMAHYPTRGVMDALVMGRLDGDQVFARYERPYGDDPQTTSVGPASVRIVEPYRTVARFLAEGARVVIADVNAENGAANV